MKKLKFILAATAALLLTVIVFQYGCKKALLEPKENGTNQIGKTEFDTLGGDDRTLFIPPAPIPCDAILASLPVQTTKDIEDNLDAIAQALVELSNEPGFVNEVNKMVSAQFDGDFEVLLKDLKISCAALNVNIANKMQNTAQRLCDNTVQSNLSRACEFRYNWDEDIMYPQIFIPFFDKTDLTKTPIIAPFKASRTESDDEIIEGYQLIFDQNDTKGLLSLLASSVANGIKKNMLLNASPLSNIVLLTTLNANLPNGHIKQIFQANAPLSQVVIDAVQLSNLPNGIVNQILNAPPVVKLTKVVIDKEKAKTCPIWIISTNESVNCEGGFEGVVFPHLTQAECGDLSPRKWLEFYDDLIFPCTNDSWVAGKGDIFYSWVRYDPFASCSQYCEGEKNVPLTRTDGKHKISKNDLCIPQSVHHEFCNTSWQWQQDIALIVFEKDGWPTSRRKWNWCNPSTHIKYRSEQITMFRKDKNTTYLAFFWNDYWTPGQWGGITTQHEMNCWKGKADPPCNNPGGTFENNLIEIRGGKEGA